MKFTVRAWKGDRQRKLVLYELNVGVFKMLELVVVGFIKGAETVVIELTK